MRAAAQWKTPLAVTVLLVVLLALAFSGQWPDLRNKLSSSPRGLLAIPENEIDRIASAFEHEDLKAVRQRPLQPGRLDGHHS